ncbi:MAG: hypothetical protein AUH41_03695 [Gemmatimonadetes bacterium 13_1_40CM_66_11]|nr:MAG: hypothetical protein AUH41_03695 [Gemmatimonadetes bacterium 13_1_40CM_66_11]
MARHGTLCSREFPTFEAAIASFLAEGPRVHIEAACFGIAGPVVGGRVTTTNLTWQFDEERLAAAIPTRRVRLLNDLAAMGGGMLAPQPNAPRRGSLPFSES